MLRKFVLVAESDIFNSASGCVSKREQHRGVERKMFSDAESVEQKTDQSLSESRLLTFSERISVSHNVGFQSLRS